jgi:hypothetical protein
MQQQNPADALTDQFLGWIADEGRSYGEVMDAWRSSCPRLTIWEDALREGYVRVQNGSGGTREQARVTLTPLGRARLNGVTTASAVPDRPTERLQPASRPAR